MKDLNNERIVKGHVISCSLNLEYNVISNTHARCIKSGVLKPLKELNHILIIG